MKKRKVFILAAVCFLMTGLAGIVNAQTPVNFGLKGGLNFANISGSDADSEIRTGFTGGISLDISVPGPLGIESGAFYSQKGAEFSEDGSEGTLSLDYIEVPVLAKVGFGPPGPASPHIILGPYVGFNVSAESEVSGGGFTFSGDISDDVNDTEFGGIAGLGIDLNLGLTKLNAQARYGMGFTNIFTEDGDEEIKNSVISIVVGIQF